LRPSYEKEVCLVSKRKQGTQTPGKHSYSDIASADAFSEVAIKDVTKTEIINKNVKYLILFIILINLFYRYSYLKVQNLLSFLIQVIL
jgi:hypothetical protein